MSDLATTTPATVEQALAALKDMPTDALRKRWASAFRATPPSRASRAFLQRSLAYRIQENAFGGLTPGTRKRLKRLMTRFARDPAFAITAVPSLKPGTRLIREWKGDMHEVEVRETGFLWQGERYASLSRIARLITGTRWSGPVFFGLKTPGPGRAR